MKTRNNIISELAEQSVGRLLGHLRRVNTIVEMHDMGTMEINLFAAAIKTLPTDNLWICRNKDKSWPSEPNDGELVWVTKNTGEPSREMHWYAWVKQLAAAWQPFIIPEYPHPL